MALRYEYKRAVIEVNWEVICALLDLPDNTRFIAAERRDNGTVGLVIEHPKLETAEMDALPVVKPVWSPPLEASFKGWQEAG